METLVCDLFIRSYFRDLGWLEYCLRSIRAHCSGFRQVVLVVPRSTYPRLGYRGLAGDVTLACDDYRDDYLGQQVTKLHADLYTDADYIAHVDSDCMFDRPTAPSDLVRSGRSRVAMAPYGSLPRSVPWKAVTEAFLGEEVRYEFMQRLPVALPRWLYEEVREHCRARHGVELASYVLSQPHRGFSEFNALGAYGFSRHRARFDWLDVTRGEAGPTHCRCYWSWGGLTPAVRADLARVVGGP